MKKKVNQIQMAILLNWKDKMPDTRNVTPTTRDWFKRKVWYGMDITVKLKTLHQKVWRIRRASNINTDHFIFKPVIQIQSADWSIHFSFLTIMFWKLLLFTFENLFAMQCEGSFCDVRKIRICVCVICTQHSNSWIHHNFIKN